VRARIFVFPRRAGTLPLVITQITARTLSRSRHTLFVQGLPVSMPHRIIVLSILPMKVPAKRGFLL
jgi:hypothetical protein